MNRKEYVKNKKWNCIQGRFDSSEEGLVKLVKEASFSTIIIHSRLKSYEEKCKAIVDILADEGIQYAKKYVIARAAYES